MRTVAGNSEISFSRSWVLGKSIARTTNRAFKYFSTHWLAVKADRVGRAVRSQLERVGRVHEIVFRLPHPIAGDPEHALRPAHRPLSPRAPPAVRPYRGSPCATRNLPAS